MTTYTPTPLDTAFILLPPSLAVLLEKLAENNHDVWAVGRIRERWTLGPTRDDAEKKHPCLVPSAALPESAKEYDRKTVSETLKAIMKLGYIIQEPN